MSDRTNTAKWYPTLKRWQINVQICGVRKTFSSSKPGRTGQLEANRKADRWLDVQMSGAANDGGIVRKRVKDAVDEYALHRAELFALSQKQAPPSSLDGLALRDYGSDRQYISNLNTWVKGAYGARWVSSIGDAEVQDILDKAKAAGRARKTISNIRNAVAQWLKYCRRKRYTKYKMDEVGIPEGAKSGKRQILQIEDLRKLFTSDKTLYRGKEVVDRFIHAYRLEVLSGPRPGELMGLDWQNWDGGEMLRIDRAINVDGYETTGKNDNALRVLRLALLAQQELHAQHLQCGRPLRGRIFPDILSQSGLRKRWYAYCDYNGIPHVTLYELRHTFVSVVQHRLPDYLLKPIIGHSKSMDTHGIYGHDFDGFEDETATTLDAVFRELLAEEKSS